MATACYDPKQVYLPASFKGVAFEALDVSVEGGRRGAVGEFPFGEHTAWQDLGRKIRRYKLSGRLADNSHADDAAALMAACESIGPGPLVHPTPAVGIVTAACTMFSIKDNPVESQGVTLIDLEFVEAETPIAGFGFVDLPGLIDISGLVETVETAFAAAWTFADVFFLDVPAVTVEASRLAAVTRDALLSQPAPPRQVPAIAADLAVLAADPAPMIDVRRVWPVIANGLAAVDAHVADPHREAAFRRIANAAAAMPALPGAAGRAVDALAGSARSLAAVYLARVLAEAVPDTCQDGLDQHDRIMTMLAEETAAARQRCDQALYLALRGVTTKLQTLLLRRSYGRPPMVTYEFPGPVSQFVAAHEIYGDGRRHRDIARWNRQFPTFAMGPRLTALRSTV